MGERPSGGGGGPTIPPVGTFQTSGITGGGPGPGPTLSFQRSGVTGGSKPKQTLQKSGVIGGSKPKQRFTTSGVSGGSIDPGATEHDPTHTRNTVGVNLTKQYPAPKYTKPDPSIQSSRPNQVTRSLSNRPSLAPRGSAPTANA